MKFSTLIFTSLFLSASAFASDFEISRSCKKQIEDSLIGNYGLEIDSLEAYGSYMAGGSDGVSSWDDEYVIKGRVKEKDGDVCGALLYVYSDSDCKVLSLAKTYGDLDSYKCNF